MDEKELSLAEKLLDKKSSVRRSAAKRIAKEQLFSLSEPLLTAYLEERKDPRSWETQCQMIRALGRIKCLAALPFISEIVDKNSEFDTITSYAATAAVRLLGDGAPEKVVLALFEKGEHSVLYGALNALFYDAVIPSEEGMRSIIQAVREAKPCENRCVGNLKELLICLMAYWPQEIIRPYLEEFLAEPDVRSIVVEWALKGKPYGPEEY